MLVLFLMLLNLDINLILEFIFLIMGFMDIIQYHLSSTLMEI